MSAAAESPTEVARTYYNSADADEFYARVWGGEDIHIGIYERPDEPIFDASRRTVDRMARSIEERLLPTTRVLDVGSGYGGSARYVAEKFRCHVDCLNLSERQNARNRELTKTAGLDDRISVTDGSFEDLPYDSGSFDVVWSQDALLHAGDKHRVFAEVSRVLADGGVFIFTDPMQSETAKPEALAAVLDRIHLSEMGSFSMYRNLAREARLAVSAIDDLTPHLVTHYAAVKRDLERRAADLRGHVSDEYIERMIEGLSHWIRAGDSGQLAWGILRLVHS